VERFLEDALLTLGYVDVAYADEPYKGVYPPINHLKAFRITSRLAQTVAGEIPKPKVTVQPNFEVYVESTLYPVGVLDRLNPLTDLVSEDVLTILKLDREKVTTATAQDESLDVVALLDRLTEHQLPGNVARELQEWGAYADKFILYDGFALLEGSEDLLASDELIDELTEVCVSPTIRVVHSPDVLFEHLEQAALVPLWVAHPASSLAIVPPPARTVFVQEAPRAKPKPEQKERVKLMRSTRITYHCPTKVFWAAFRQALLDTKCPVEANSNDLTLVIPGQYEEHVLKTLEELREMYQIQVENISA